MITPYEIPLQAKPQGFYISLAGTTYFLKLKWNSFNGSWILDIFDDNQELIVGSIPLITGADLLAPYRYLGFGGGLVVQTDNNPNEVPDFGSLGDTGHLYFIS